MPGGWNIPLENKAAKVWTFHLPAHWDFG